MLPANISREMVQFVGESVLVLLAVQNTGHYMKKIWKKDLALFVAYLPFLLQNAVLNIQLDFIY